MRYYLAIDIGASSGRHILGHVENGRMVLEEMYRFDNKQILKNGHDCWDINHLWQSILQGLKACKAANKVPVTLGIDTWAVDFVLVDGDGTPVSDAVAYRDGRTKNIRSELEHTLTFAQHYSHTGIQYQPFNTVYQLLALQKENPLRLQQAYHMLMIPDYFHYLLTGKMVQEYTNATSTALVNAKTGFWDEELINMLGLPKNIFTAIAMPGTTVGTLKKEIVQQIGFDCAVVLPATHDTGSAFLAVPARTETAVYISSGTWSLLGVENKTPITSPQSMAENFTNEGGYEYRYRYLKNIMGLWMIQSVRRELNGVAYIKGKEHRTAANVQYSYAELEKLARQEKDFSSTIDVDDPRFLAPESMMEAVKSLCVETNQSVPQTVGQIMQCVYKSLAYKYKAAIETLQRLTGKQYTCIHIVGGGSKDGYLNELCAKATGLPVYAGPTEGTALGNLMVQMIAGKEYANLLEARQAIKNSFEIKEIKP
ncbi:MAG: rhamnulokinase [Oscillospiraceae bacterium]|nr:rhamnulokinase [Oscillospiraceae bacterium]